MEQLSAMGFEGPLAEQALKQAGGDIEVAVNMLVTGAVNEPEAPSGAAPDADADSIQALTSMGYSDEEARHALQAAGGDLGLAVEVLLPGASVSGEAVEEIRADAHDPPDLVLGDELEANYNPMAVLAGGSDAAIVASASAQGAEIARAAMSAKVDRILAMGFDEDSVKGALSRTNGDENAALQILLEGS